MTDRTLRGIVADGLAEIGVSLADAGVGIEAGRVRRTIWLPMGQKFGIRSYASGRQVYIVQARMAGRPRTVTIAPTTLVSQADAARIARRVVAEALVGNDPATGRQRIRSAPSWADFLQEYWRKCGPHWKASTRTTQDIYRRLYLDDAFPDRFIDGIQHADVVRWFNDLSDKAGPGGANRCLSILHAMLNRAEAWGYRPEHSNPVAGVRRNKPRRHGRFLSEPELARLGAVLTREMAGRRRVHATALAVLLLTGCRVSEVLGLHWSDIAGTRLKLRDSKTGPRTVWIGDDVRALLSGLPRHRAQPWVFWEPHYRKPVRSLRHIWLRVRGAAELPDLRLHDLRHSFASHAAARCETVPMIGRLLGHARVASTARYTHLDDADVRNAAFRIGEAIETIMTGKALDGVGSS